MGIKVILSDTYDFTEFRPIFTKNGFSFSNLANDLGCELQFNDMLTPYYWSLSFTYYF